MTSDLKADGRRKRSHQRSKSSIGDYALSVHLDPVQDVVQMKESPKADKKDHSRSWFKSKTLSRRSPEVGSDLEVEDEKLSQQHRVVQGLYRDDDGGPSPKTLATSLSAAREAVKEFAKDFVTQLKAGDPDETLAMESQMRQHLLLPSSSPPAVALKFVAQAYIVRQFFSGFENAAFGISNPGEKPWEVQDHMRRCFAQFQKFKMNSQTVSTLVESESSQSTDLNFLSQFCVQKFRKIVPSEAFFGGDCLHHLELEKGNHPDTPFYRSFLGAAVSVWLLQRLAFSFEQKIVPIVPTRGDEFQRRFMAPVVPGIGDAESEENDGSLEIAFTVFPGFRVSESVVESLVYIVETLSAHSKAEIPTSVSVAQPPVEGIPKSLEAETEHSLLPDSSVIAVETLTAHPTTEIPTSTSVAEPPVETTQKSLKGGEHSLIQRIRSKFLRKKTLAKGTILAENSATVAAAPPLKEHVSSAPSSEEPAPSNGEEPAPSNEKLAPTLEESATPRAEAAPLHEEPSPSTDNNAGQNTTSATNTASELSSPISQAPNFEPRAPPSTPVSAAVNDGGPLYTPRARKSLQSPLRSPRLSSVD